MCTQDPVQAVIWHCLDYYDYKNAVFLAERLYAESETDETTYLLATCYYRANRVSQAFWLLKKKSYRSPKCRYLQARCACDLKDYAAAAHVLANYDDGTNDIKDLDMTSKDFGDIACYVLQLLGQIYRKSQCTVMASKVFRQSLKLNPFLWHSYVELCNMGENVDPSETFNITDLSFAELRGQCICHQCQDSNKTTLEDFTQKGFYTPKNNANPQFLNAACNHCSTPCTNENEQIHRLKNESGFDLLTEQFSSLTSISPVAPSCDEKNVFEKQTAVSNGDLSAKWQATSVIFHQTTGNLSTKLHVFTPAGNTPARNPLDRQNLKTQMPNLETDLAKENKLSPQATNATLGKWSPRKTKFRFSKEIRLDELDEDGLPNALDNISIAKNQTSPPAESTTHSVPSLKQHSLNMKQNLLALRKQSADNFMALLRDFGHGFRLLANYQCKKAIQHFELNTPKHQLNSSALQSMVAKCYYELHYYDEAAKIFKKIHETEPHRFEYMDVYSSCLWQLQQPVELSALAQDLVLSDRLSPITWCVVGNCFSLQNDHTTAIKLMQRAVQVDPDFAYGYTLLGYEHVYHEDLEEARGCFASAIARDSRHYNALFGIGTTYAKQLKHQTAEFYFRRALKINPTNSVILVHIAVMQHAQQHYQQALLSLNAATKLDPKNMIAKLQRARIFFALRRYQQALQQLEELKNMAPKESVVFQLLGNVYQAMGHNEMALMYFSWSMDMDSKKTEPFTPVLPKRCL